MRASDLTSRAIRFKLLYILKWVHIVSLSHQRCHLKKPKTMDGGANFDARNFPYEVAFGMP